MVVLSPDSRQRLAALLLGLLGCALLASCKVDNAPAGGLVLSLETDLAVPKDIDRVELEITQEGKLIRLDEQPIGSGHTLLPTEIRLAYPGNDRPLLIRATAFHGAEARIERSSVTPVPRSWLGLVRMPLSYLCDGTALPEGGSTCGEGNTCNQGTCGSAELPLDDQQRYTPGAQPQKPSRNAADSGMLSGNVIGDAPADAAQSGCFDVSTCFAKAQLLDIDASTCSFSLPPAAAGARISVALMLPLGSAGICDNGGCFVPLDLDSGGYSFGDGGEVLLPKGVCDKLLEGVPLRAAISSSCGEKTSQNPPCGPWSSVQSPRPVQDVSALEPGNSSAPSLLGGACSGPARQACGMCGTQARECHDGSWDKWGTCDGQGTCKPGETEACGRGGTRSCGGNCEWGACLTQTCSGPSSQSCGNCGTQTRTCDNGVWSAWSACNGQGECAPNETRGCGSSGSQACGGNCRWGSCGNQSCTGAPSQACGSCGTRTRGCDAASGMWSSFGECTDQGECAPNVTRACGTGGNQACRGDCSWDSVCAGQTCRGESTRACGNCGTQTRNCDSNTGTWGAWSSCTGEGECAPNDTSACGAGGTRVCGGNCRWDATCSGQTCAGAAQQSCGNCGTQTRTCNPNTGTWSNFSACMNEGACRPGASRGCGSGGTQTCTNSCQWPTACGMQSCAGPATQECGNCGTQARTCNANTGQYGAWSACTDEKTCDSGATRVCGGTGSQSCGDSCEWNATCDCPAGTHLCGDQCVSNSSVNSCGASCSPCTAPVGGTPSCNGTSCGYSCGTLTQCGASCFDTQNDPTHCGDCNTTCPRGESCVQGRCSCPTGQHRCLGVCVSNDSPANCGTTSCAACVPPAGATATCDGTSCGFTCTSGTMCKSACADLNTDNNNCGACDTMCLGGRTCQAARCQCPRGTHDCDGQCVSDTSVATCGASCSPCVVPPGGVVTCDGKSCVPSCPLGTHNCSGSCVSDTSITQCGPNCLQCPSGVGGEPVCRAGVCALACSEGMTECRPAGAAAYCANLQTESNNCGTCGMQCLRTQYCFAGTCTFPPIN